MARLLVTIALVLLAVVSVHAFETESPVPEGFSLPNIFNPVTDRAEGREQAKVLVNLVAKEPSVAFGVGGPEAPIEDTWNGEKDPESSASVQQKKMMKEVESLENLIAQGQKILKVLPRKQARLALLKQKLSVILDAKAKREAAEKLDQQEALLAAIKKREGAMSTRLTSLKSSQNKLESSVKKLKKVITGEDKKAPKVGAVGGNTKASDKAATRTRFAQEGLDSEEQAEIGGEMETESEQELDQEIDQEAEMEMAADEAQ